MTLEFEPIVVKRVGGGGLFTSGLRGVRLGRVAAYDFVIPEPHFVRPGLPRVDRAYVLLDEGIQLACPPGFPEDQAGWWYVDLVEVAENDRALSVTDHYLDVIVGPPGHAYRLLDMHEFGEAIADGKLSQAQAVTGLRNFQHFLDTHLNRRHDITLDWPDFPPASIAQLRAWKSDLFPEGGW